MDNQQVPQVTNPQGSTSQFPQNNVTTVTTQPVILASNEPKLDTQPQVGSNSKITDEEVIAVTQAVMQPAIQGQIVETKHPGGRPSKYNEGMYRIAQEYYISCIEGEVVKNNKGEMVRRKKMPLIEELARLCDVDHETLENWTKDNEEFFALYKKIKSHQRESLINRGFQMKNPTFAIFLLKAQHGMMESEKQILVADRDVKVSITRE